MTPLRTTVSYLPSYKTCKVAIFRVIFLWWCMCPKSSFSRLCPGDWCAFIFQEPGLVIVSIWTILLLLEMFQTAAAKYCQFVTVSITSFEVYTGFANSNSDHIACRGLLSCVLAYYQVIKDNIHTVGAFILSLIIFPWHAPLLADCYP